MTRKTSSLQKGLVLHLPLDKESLQSATVFADKTPYENAGTSANPIVFVPDRMGQVDRAMSFNGVNDYVNCGNDPSLDITDAITISAWIKPTLWNNHWNCIVVKGTNWTTGITVWANPSGRLYVSIAGMHYSFNYLSLNQWQHVVVTYSSTTQKIITYINGVYFSKSRSGVLPTTTPMLIGIQTIGTYPGGYGQFIGSIADVRMYDRALSPEEITALYEQYRPKVKIVAGKPKLLV